VSHRPDAEKFPVHLQTSHLFVARLSRHATASHAPKSVLHAQGTPQAFPVHSFVQLQVAFPKYVLKQFPWPEQI
jgi:hypothetical protein